MPVRNAKVNQIVKEQFAVFASDGYTKVTGQAGSCVATLWKDGIVSAVSVVITEIGTSGEYVATLTPNATGMWELEIKDSANTLWNTTIEVRESDVDSLAASLTTILTQLASVYKITTGRWKIDTDANTLTFYDDDDTTPLFVYDLLDDIGIPSTDSVFERNPQ